MKQHLNHGTGSRARHLLVGGGMLVALVASACGQLVDIPEGILSEDVEMNCDNYCDRMTNECPKPNLQFNNRDTCMSVCATWATGQLADNGNTLGCRFAVTLAEASDCAVAGPMGGSSEAGFCGSPCHNFCELYDAACFQTLNDDPGFGDVASCKFACDNGAFPVDGVYDDETAKSENFTTTNCAMYHTTVATEGPVLHCPHPYGAGTPPHCDQPFMP